MINPDIDPELARLIDTVLRNHPEVAVIIRQLVADHDAHPLNVTHALNDPARRPHTLEMIAELADGRVLDGRTLAEYLADHPGAGPLFESLPPEVNTTADGLDRKQAAVDAARELDLARAVGPAPDPAEQAAVRDYAQRLRAVQRVVEAEIAALADQIDGAATSVRTKTAEGILDKVRRMTTGSETRPPRPDYRVGDVIDAVGARITVGDTAQLAELLRAVQEHFGVGEGGRILEIENMYEAPKSGNPAYRVIPLTVSVEIDGLPYTFELQLTTERASVAADINHNTTYKPYVPPTGEQRAIIEAMFAEAAALEQEETRRPHDD